MEFHPDQTDKVQFWAYKGDNPAATAGNYFPNPALDVEGNKPMPQICMGCHQGSYGGNGTLVNGAVFLPFDVDSFIGDNGAALDEEGNKPMPQICMGCHQGSYGVNGTLVNGAVFLPFDVDSFIGDNGAALDWKST